MRGRWWRERFGVLSLGLRLLGRGTVVSGRKSVLVGGRVGEYSGIAL